MKNKIEILKFKKIMRENYFSTLKCHFSSSAGQTLVTLIFFMVIATTVTTAAILVITTNILSGSRFQEGTIAYQIADSGAENALIRILRDPSYEGETLSVGSGSATIQVDGEGTGMDPYIIISKGQKGSYIKRVEVTAVYENDELDVISRKEIF
jgi:hypothetical protein